MKKIMILGAGIYQVPLIKTAKKMGYTTIVVSIPGNYPGFAFADTVYYEDTVDEDKVLELAQKEAIDGIITTGTDVCVGTIGRVCDAMGLPGLSSEAAEIAVDKMLMKSRYEAYGVRTARFRKVFFREMEAADKKEDLIDDLQFPLIFKSVDSSGSRGITRVDSFDDFDRAVAYVQNDTRKDYFLIEEFIEGEEFGAQAFVYEGEAAFILPHGDYVFKGDTGVPVGHYAPFDLDASIIEDATQQLRRAIKAMGVNNCALNVDFILKNDKPYLIEIGGRCGATCLAELVSIYYSFDYYEKILKVAMGENPAFDFTRSAVPNASHLLMSDKDGILKSQIDHNPPCEEICEVQFDYEPGETVHKFHVGPHRIGHVITKGATLKEAQDRLAEAMENIEITVD